VLYADNRKEALDKVMSLIPKEVKVGIGGSVTVRDIGLVDPDLQRSIEGRNFK